MNIKVRLSSDNETLCSVANGFFADNDQEGVLVFESDIPVADEDHAKQWIEKRGQLALALLSVGGPLAPNDCSFAIQYVGPNLVVSNDELDEED